ncbi:LLM class flavin-dependent oxidoreductase [Xanthomonas hyacinthi]|uniref:LLM class flavin-dependent oxidoreductase n=1 Tax=Xanthomonas hyacinthi TaxID=56455 RepID=A0A2S7EQC1_9XANT|nr:Atu2307/SP_0267 family LLM class monooxygenase [Xanthomonas hyacinthi]KLD75085.1 luciferase [Xanthomonas hyacinthi DSM 19077]PPU95311.1 LLM class flavin-dependent oxidoreductase [Xanthomonas hyacinthi]QGY78586.1 LLM class flavin-dependent oxidoreductase [Xanthomonas hyacinthi]
MDIGIHSFAAVFPDPATGALPCAAGRMAGVLEEIELAERVGLDFFGIGEHHRAEFLDSTPVVILAAAAARTSRIRLTSAVTVLSAADPVRVFQAFATLDLISRGRAEIVAGRGSSVEAFPLFGLSMRDYDDLFAEKLELLLTLGETTNPTWEGRFRPALTGQGVFPRPHQARMPLWLGVGGTPESFERAGRLGLPLMIAIIGGTFERFRPLVDLYREAGARAGHDPATLKVAVHAMGFVADSDEDARDIFFPGWAQMIGKYARERGWAQPDRAQFDDMAGPDGAFLIGSPATVAARMRHASEVLGGVSRIAFQMTSAAFKTAAMIRSIELVGTEVAPIIRAARAKS